MTNDEMMMAISEALCNLKEEYPNKDKAGQAFGKLMAIMKWRADDILTMVHLEEGYSTQERR